MKRPRTTADRIAISGMVVFSALWCLFVIVVALAFQGSDGASAWEARAVIMGVAALMTAGYVVVARIQWRRAIARPLPVRGLSGWFARQSLWRLAFIIGAGYSMAWLGLLVGTSIYEHRSPPWYLALVVLPAVALGAPWAAAMNHSRWQRQAERGQHEAAADIAREPHDDSRDGA